MNAAKLTWRLYSAVVLIAALLVSGGAARSNDLIHVGKAQGTAWTFLPVDVGIEHGFFAKHGLDIEIVNLGGDAKVQQALAAGSVDFGLASGPGMALAAKGGMAIGIAAFAGPPRNISAVVLAGSPIKNMADLNGKLIAVSTVGSLSEWLAKQMAIQEGWGQDGVRTVPLGAAETSLAALKSKQIDAMILSTESGLKLEERKEVRIVATMDRYAPHFIAHVVYTQKARVASNPGQVERFLNAFFAAIAFMKTHTEQTSATAGRVLDYIPAVARKVHDFEIGMLSDDGRFDPQAVAVLKQSFVDMGAFKSQPADDVLFTTQFLQAKP